MAKYLGIPLTVSNGNKVPLTAQPELISNNDFSVSGNLTTSSWELGWESSDTVSYTHLTLPTTERV